MIEQGFAAVKAPLAEMRRLHARSPVNRVSLEIRVPHHRHGGTPQNYFEASAHEKLFGLSDMHSDVRPKGIHR